MGGTQVMIHSETNSSPVVNLCNQTSYELCAFKIL